MAAAVASPVAPPQPGLWSSILAKASSSRAVLSKSVVILGDASSGKSTLLAALKGVAPNDADSGTDLALAHTAAEVRDDDEIAARLSLFRLASSPAYASLLPFALNAESLDRTAICICLDWKKPWTWIESLERWLGILEYTVTKEIEAKDFEVVAKARDDLESLVRGYSEPAREGGDSAPAPQVSTASVVVPLPEGCLTKNLGLPIVVVCSKADATKGLERDHDFKEAQFDFIQQTLRVICLKYGAALFTVSASQSTYPSLRSYLIHRLLRTSSPRVAAKHSEIRPQIVDRDRVVVPTGWDSRGKIGALDPTFDCDGIGKASWGELKRIWEDKIRERRGVENALSAKPVIAAEDDQEFLKRLLNGAAPALSSSMPSRAPAGDLDDITAKLARLGKRGDAARTASAPAGGGTGDSKAIANFFDSLLKKPPARGGANSPSLGQSDG